MAMIFLRTECVTRTQEYLNHRLTRFLYSVLRYLGIVSGGVHVCSPKMADAPTHCQHAVHLILLYKVFVEHDPMRVLTLYTRAALTHPLNPLSLLSAFCTFSECQPSLIERWTSITVSWGSSFESRDSTVSALQLWVGASFR